MMQISIRGIDNGKDSGHIAVGLFGIGSVAFLVVFTFSVYSRILLDFSHKYELKFIERLNDKNAKTREVYEID